MGTGKFKAGAGARGRRGERGGCNPAMDLNSIHATETGIRLRPGGPLGSNEDFTFYPSAGDSTLWKAQTLARAKGSGGMREQIPGVDLHNTYKNNSVGQFWHHVKNELFIKSTKRHMK